MGSFVVFTSCNNSVKMRAPVVLAFCFAVVAGVTGDPQRIMGGSLTTITQYPSMVSLLRSTDLQVYWQECAGSIINTRSILTAAHCTYGWSPVAIRARVGSTYANSGGVVHGLATIINNPYFNTYTWDSDIAIVRTASAITYVNSYVQPAFLAGPNYNIADNSVVWATGWGATFFGGPTSEQLRHVQIWTVNQATCANNYWSIGFTITSNMLCSGYYGVGGRDQCSQDSGGPLYHNGVVVGVCSYGQECGNAYYPGVNTRVSPYYSWISANA